MSSTPIERADIDAAIQSAHNYLAGGWPIRSSAVDRLALALIRLDDLAATMLRELAQLRGDLAAERQQVAQLKERIAGFASTAGGHKP